MADLSQEYEPDTLDVPGKNSSGGQSASVAESAMNLQRLPPGLLKWERYQIVDFLGAGAMGTVFKAQDPRLNRFVALKFIKDAGASRELALRFYREARSQAGIEHEYICKIYEVGEVEGQPYIAMQYIEGETLTTGRNKLSLPQKVQVIKLVAEALHAAHRQGMIHRDLKQRELPREKCPATRAGEFRGKADRPIARLSYSVKDLLAHSLLLPKNKHTAFPPVKLLSVQQRPTDGVHGLLKRIRIMPLAYRNEECPLGLVIHRQLRLQPLVIDTLLNAKRNALQPQDVTGK